MLFSSLYTFFSCLWIHLIIKCPCSKEMGSIDFGCSFKEQKPPLTPSHKCWFFAKDVVVQAFLIYCGILPRYCAMLLFLTAGLGQLLQTYLLQTKCILVHRPYVVFVSLEELDAFPGKYLTLANFYYAVFVIVSLSESAVGNRAFSTVWRLNLI